MKKILTIAGSDSSGGAGIQADIKTITAHRMYAMSAVTALTAQNTTGVYGIQDVDADFVAAQLDAVFSDIVPDAVKIGMVSNADIIKIIAHKLVQYKAKNIVLDPVMVSTSGKKLLDDNAVLALKKELMPITNLITPNIAEAKVLCGFAPAKNEEMEKAGIAIFSEIFTGRDDCGVLIKGGHLADTANDVLRDKSLTYIYRSKRVNNSNTHGTGCTLSSAIACNLAAGLNLHDSIKYAKKYITLILANDFDLGQGNGPLNHMTAGGWISKDVLDWYY